MFLSSSFSGKLDETGYRKLDRKKVNAIYRLSCCAGKEINACLPACHAVLGHGESPRVILMPSQTSASMLVTTNQQKKIKEGELLDNKETS